MKIAISLLMMTLAASAHAAAAKADDVPANLRVPDGNKMLFTAHADGTQNYVCLPGKTGGFAWTLYGPDAVLHAGKDGAVIGMHFLSSGRSRRGASFMAGSGRQSRAGDRRGEFVR